MKRLALLCFLVAAAPAFADESMNRYFDQLDLNGDGYVSLSEAAGDPVVVNRFDRADRNRDGKLSRQEFARLPKIKVRVATKKKEPSAAVGGTAPKKQEKASGG